MDYVWFKTVWNKLLCISRYILVPEMAVLVQVEPAEIVLCWVFFFFLCMMFSGLKTGKKKKKDPCCMLNSWFE